MNKNWIEIPFSEVVSSKKGKKPKVLKDKEFDNSVPYLDIKAFEKGEIRRFADIASSNLIDSNSIGIVWDGARSGWVSKGKSGAIGSTIAKLTPNIVDVNYVFRFLQANFKLLNTETKGTGIPHINPDVLWRLKFPLAPLNEQERIADKLDIIFEKLEINKNRLNKIPVILKDFKRTILNSAFNGELTSKWRKERELTSIFDIKAEINSKRKIRYQNICNEYKNNGFKKPSKPSNLSISPLKMKDNWTELTLEDLASVEPYSISSGPFGSALGRKDYVPVGIPVIRGQNIKPSKFINENFVFINDKKAYELLRSSVKAGDLVIVAVGAGAGDAVIYPDSVPSGILSQNCNKFSLDLELVDPKFIELHLQVISVKDQMAAFTTDVARPFLSLRNLKEVKLSVPPLLEQKEIVRKINELFSVTDAIEAKYLYAKTTIEKLPESILAKAFRGELLKQDPNDEPAEKLLERILAEKDKLKKSKKK